MFNYTVVSRGDDGSAATCEEKELDRRHEGEFGGQQERSPPGTIED